jgi:hypothetical protein
MTKMPLETKKLKLALGGFFVFSQLVFHYYQEG